MADTTALYYIKPKILILSLIIKGGIAYITFWYFTYHIAVISNKNKNFSLKHLKKKSSVSKYTPFLMLI